MEGSDTDGDSYSSEPGKNLYDKAGKPKGQHFIKKSSNNMNIFSQLIFYIYKYNFFKSPSTCKQSNMTETAEVLLLQILAMLPFFSS